jgi:circadian clock protein KaiC
MKSIGINLKPYIKKGLLEIHSSRPSLNGLELHLLTLRKLIRQFKPSAVVIDPISNFITVGSESEVRALFIRLIDLLKANNITSVFTTLYQQNETKRPDLAQDSISSLVDTWSILETWRV